MRAIVIDAKKQQVYEQDIRGSLKCLQQIVGGYIELATHIDDEHDLFVDEEGLLKQPEHFFEYEGAHQPFAGNGVIVSHDDEGETKGAKLSLEEVRARVTFMSGSEIVARMEELP
jgi:hypothetical protein